MKTAVKYVLHKLLGFRNYLFVFALFKIRTLKTDKNEKDFFRFLSLIPPNTIVLDIGANIGIMTYHLANAIKNVKVYSFEPIPNNIATLKRIISYFKLTNVNVMECALGNTNGEVEMVMPVINSVKMQGLSHVLHKSIEDNNEGDKFTVPLKMLDTIEELSDTREHISAIKIDVENFEFFVLDGAKKILQKHRPIIYAELWDNENRLKCFNLLLGINYSAFVVEQNKMLPFDKTRHKTQNFIFLPA